MIHACPLSFVLAGLLPCLSIAATHSRSGEVASWDFEGEVSPLPLQAGSAPSELDISGGVLHLDNEGLSDSRGVALVVADAPVLTGHDNGGSGYGSLIIEADVMPTGSGKQAQIVRKTDGEIGYQLYLREDGKVGFIVRTPKGSMRLTSKNKVPADGQWHHIEAMWDKSQWLYNAQLAVDGVVSWASAPEMGTLTDTAAPLTIGGYYRSEGNIGQRFDGKLDNVRLYVDQPERFKVSGRPPMDVGAETGGHLLDQPGLLSAEFVYANAPTPECHAGTLAQREDGTVVAAWFGGTREGHIDSGIWQSEFDGMEWSQPREVAHATYPNNTLSASFNPVLFQYPDGGPMLLFYLGGKFDMSFLMTSEDGGKSWGEPQRLPAGVRGASKNKPVLLEDGTLICPDNSGSRMSFDRTKDFGKTWLPTVMTPKSEIDAIQPTILTHQDGRLQALARSHTGAIVQSWSDDNGATWSTPEKTSLPNNYSGIDAVTLKDGRHLLIYNHSGIPKGKWGGPRTPLNIAVSEDGNVWYAALVLEDEPGEYSYPVVIQDEDGTVHALYTWNRVRMKHVEIDPEELVLREIKDGVWPAGTRD